MVYHLKATPAEIVGLLKLFGIYSPIFPEVNEGYRSCFVCRISRINEAMIVFFGSTDFPIYSDFSRRLPKVPFVELIGFPNIEFVLSGFKLVLPKIFCVLVGFPKMFNNV